MPKSLTFGTLKRGTSFVFIVVWLYIELSSEKQSTIYTSSFFGMSRAHICNWHFLMIYESSSSYAFPCEPFTVNLPLLLRRKATPAKIIILCFPRKILAKNIPIALLLDPLTQHWNCIKPNLWIRTFNRVLKKPQKTILSPISSFLRKRSSPQDLFRLLFLLKIRPKLFSYQTIM